VSCKDCNFYNKDKRICIKTEQFQFESMPVCNEFKEDIEGEANE
jgi:hypothetical protein